MIEKEILEMIDRQELRDYYRIKYRYYPLKRYKKTYRFIVPKGYENVFVNKRLLRTHNVNKFVKWLKIIGKTDDYILEFLRDYSTDYCTTYPPLLTKQQIQTAKGNMNMQGVDTVIFEEMVISKKGEK